MRRVVRFGAALGVDPSVPDADYEKAIGELSSAGHSAKAKAFAAQYAAHDPAAALVTMLQRVESALPRRAA
jgi:hypothetical protein